MHIGDLERNNGFTASRRYVIFPFRYAPRSGRSLRRGLNRRARVCYGFLDAIACSLASPRMNFAIKAASEAPTYFLFLAPLPTYSLPALPFHPSPPPLFAQIQSLVYSRGISLPHSSSALLTSAAIARSWNSTALDIGLLFFFFPFLLPFSLPPPPACLPPFSSPCAMEPRNNARAWVIKPSGLSYSKIRTEALREYLAQIPRFYHVKSDDP